MSCLRHALLIARRDVVLIVWRREGLAWVFVMPIVFFYFLTAATGALRSPTGPGNAVELIGLRAPADAGILIDELIGRLEQQNFLVERPATEAAWLNYTRRLSLSRSPDAAGDTIEMRYESDLDEPLAAFDRFRIARAAFTVLADAFVIALNGESLDRDAFAELAAMPRAIDLDISAAGRREVPPTGIAQAGPGTIVLFIMLVAITGGTIHIVLERDQGLLRRLAATPISRSSIILGKLAGRFAVAVIQIVFALVSGVILFRMDWGPSLLVVVAVLAVWAVLNATLSVLLGNLARTAGQALGIGIMTTMVLAALGGVWWPIEIAPDWMQRLASFVPTGWAMDAMHKLVNFAYEPVTILPHVIGMLAASLVLGWAAVRTFRY